MKGLRQQFATKGWSWFFIYVLEKGMAVLTEAAGSGTRAELATLGINPTTQDRLLIQKGLAFHKHISKSG